MKSPGLKWLQKPLFGNHEYETAFNFFFLATDFVCLERALNVDMCKQSLTFFVL